MILSLDNIDRAATMAVNGLHCGLTDGLWRFCSIKAVWIPLYLFIVWLLMRRLGWKKGLAAVLAAGLTVLCCDQLAGLVKHLVARPRPCHDEAMLAAGLRLLESAGGQFGFFSGHAANAFGIAACSAAMLATDKNHRYGWYRWCIFIWAALVGVSRVFVGKHYLGDVLVGAVAGLLIGLAIALLTRLTIDKLSSSPSGCHGSPSQAHTRP